VIIEKFGDRPLSWETVEEALRGGPVGDRKRGQKP
jgi:hypothetical protein